MSHEASTRDPFADDLIARAAQIGAFIPGADGVPQPVTFVVPRASVEVLPAWGGDAGMGMQASGSNSVRLSGVFIPDRHIIPSPVGLLSTHNLPEGTPGTRLHGEGLFLGIGHAAVAAEIGCRSAAAVSGRARRVSDSRSTDG